MRVHSLSLFAACAALVCAVPGHAESLEQDSGSSRAAPQVLNSGGAASEKAAHVGKKVKVAAVSSEGGTVPSDQPVVVKKKKAKVKVRPAAPRLRASINLSNQTMTVSVDGSTRHVWKISSGKRGYRTPTGNYRPQWLNRMHYSKKYDNAPMPHSVFFHGGYAIHATYATGRLGSPASHGCVRLSPSSAKTFFRLVQKYGKSRTRIAIRGVARGGRSYAKRKKRRRVKRRSASHGGSVWATQPARRKVKVRRQKRRVARVKPKKKTVAVYASGYSAPKYRWPGD